MKLEQGAIYAGSAPGWGLCFGRYLGTMGNCVIFESSPYCSDRGYLGRGIPSEQLVHWTFVPIGDGKDGDDWPTEVEAFKILGLSLRK